MGIDPGTTITGYGIISCKGKKMELLACGVIKLGSQQISHPEKLKKIFLRVSSLIQDFGPKELALEAPFHGKNVQSMLKLGRAQGVAMAAGLVHDLPIFEYAPKKVKMSVTGNGSASKEQVAKMLEHLLGREITTSYMDATDGLAVAVCHFFQGNFSEKNTNYKDWASFIENNPNRIKK
ncbi:MAG: crossover junction endodeoxyribonuclease RuvC [Bacteroidia bacterium]